MCSNYEKQLQVIQGQEAETRDQVTPSLRHSITVGLSEMFTKCQGYLKGRLISKSKFFIIDVFPYSMAYVVWLYELE